MQFTIMVTGAAAEVAAWWLISSRGRNVWRLMPVVLGAMGIAAVLSRPPVSATLISDGTAALVGVASGVALFVATRAFVWLAAAWEPFRRDVVQKYQEAAEVALPESLLISLAIMVPAEELFWRGLFQGRFSSTLSIGLAAIVTWCCYVIANSASRSLPIIAGAVVGGGLWTWLAWWSGGVLASLASHILWTGLMLAFPPGPGRKPRLKPQDP